MATVSILNLLTGSSTPLLASGDVVPFVDVSDNTQSPGGSTVKATLTQFFEAIPVPISTTSTLGLAGTPAVANAVINYSTLMAVSTGAYYGLSSSMQFAKTASAFTGYAIGVVGHGAIDSTNTQNWTGDGVHVPLSGLYGQVDTEAGATGTISEAASVNAVVSVNGGTITKWSGLRVQSPTISAPGAITNAYGVYIEAISGAATLNYALYTNAGLVRFGGAVICASSANVVGDLSVNTNKLTVNATTGLVTAAGQIMSTVLGGAASSGVTIDSALPSYAWNETDAGADEKRWALTASGGLMSLFLVNDASDTIATAFSFARSGITPGLATIGGTLAVLGSSLTLGGNAVASPILNINGTDATNKIIRWQSAGAEKFTMYAEATTHKLIVATATVTALTIEQAGKVVTAASLAGTAGLNLPHGTAPSAPVNGDMWTTTAGLFVRINGVTVGPLS